MQDDPIILESAYRHDVGEDDMLHALPNSVRQFVLSDDMVMIIGPARDGLPIEVGVVDWHGAIAIAHAMRPAHDKILK